MGMAYATSKVELGGGFSVKGGAAFAMRSPSLAELYSDEPYVPIIRFGNSYASGMSDLDPERNCQLDIGLAHEGKNVTYGARSFYSEVRDYIALVPAYLDPSAPDFIDGGHALGRDFSYFDWRTDVGTANENADTNQAGYIYRNVDRATFAGFDVFADFQVLDWLATGGSMAYVEGTNHAPLKAIFDGVSNTAVGFVPAADAEPLPGIYPLHGEVWICVFEPKEQIWSIEPLVRMASQQHRVAVTCRNSPRPASQCSTCEDFGG